MKRFSMTLVAALSFLIFYSANRLAKYFFYPDQIDVRVGTPYSKGVTDRQLSYGGMSLREFVTKHSAPTGIPVEDQIED